MSGDDESPKASELEQVEEAWNFSLFDAIMNRRSRRFGLGMEISEGPNKFKSPNEPVPLDELEEAILIAAGTGITGLNLGDLPWAARAEKAILWSSTRAEAGQAHAAPTAPSSSTPTTRVSIFSNCARPSRRSCRSMRARATATSWFNLFSTTG